MYAIVKRLGDLFLSIVVLLLLTPLLIPLFLILRFTGEGEIFYRQKRIGYLNKPFDILKFATMLKDSPNLGTGLLTLRNDPRVTPAGGFLRKTKINELPQVFNVLIGNMSVVGPRPLVEKNYLAYPVEIREKIYLSKPGITGIGSIIFRDEEFLISNTKENPHEFYLNKIAPYKGALEIWYLKNKSFITDFKIIFLTAWYIVFPKSTLVQSFFKSLPQKPSYLNA
jgi:lipopolysaccharide/colanic/teichoic acid biosynthesis glycosyltransferase